MLEPKNAWLDECQLPFPPYEQLRDELTDRQVPNRAYVQKVKIARQLSQRQARQLLAAVRAQRDHTQRQQGIQVIQTDIDARAVLNPNPSSVATATPVETKELARLRQLPRRSRPLPPDHPE